MIISGCWLTSNILNIYFTKGIIEELSLSRVKKVEQQIAENHLFLHIKKYNENLQR
jgi:hypothetical protein